MKDRFTPEEWDLLKLTPFLSFAFVSQRLSEVKRLKLKDAQKIFETWLTHPGGYTDALHREVALDTPQAEWNALLEESRDPTKIEPSVLEGGEVPERDETLAMLSRLLVIRKILANKLILEQYESFMRSVLTTSADAPFRNVPKKGREPAVEAASMLAGMLLKDPTASVTVSMQHVGA